MVIKNVETKETTVRVGERIKIQFEIWREKDYPFDYPYDYPVAAIEK